MTQGATAIPEVQEVHHIAGEDCFLVKVRAPDTEALSRLLRDRFGALPAVRSTRTTVVLRTVKESGALPLGVSEGELSTSFRIKDSAQALLRGVEVFDEDDDPRLHRFASHGARQLQRARIRGRICELYSSRKCAWSSPGAWKTR